MSKPLIIPNVHSEKCCKNAPFVGARYKRKNIDIWTGEDRGWYFCTVTEVEEFKPHHFGFCRHVFFKTDCGFSGHSQTQNFLKDWLAIDNVVKLPKSKTPPDDQSSGVV